MSLPKALRLTTPKVAEALFRLALGVIGLTHSRVSATDIASVLPEDALIMVLDGPDGAVGAAVVSGALVGAIIQKQTIGQVTAPKGEVRNLTRTDAALVAPFLNAVLERASTLLDTDADRRVLLGFEFGARVDDARALELAVDAGEFHAFKITVDIEQGVHQGDLIFLLPVEDRPQPLNVSADKGQAAKGALGKVVMDSQAELVAVLCSLRLPLCDIEKFQIGDSIPIDRAVLKHIGLHVQGGRKICTGLLGQSGGYRAVRVSPEAGAASRLGRLGPGVQLRSGAQSAHPEADIDAISMDLGETGSATQIDGADPHPGNGGTTLAGTENRT